MPESAIHILAIDDSPQTIRLIEENLADAPRMHFDLHHESRLATGLAALRKKPFDVILLDLTLPDSLGLDTFHTTHRESPNTPIVILTNADDDALAVEAMRRGAQDYLVKNFLDGRLLARAIWYAVERNRASLELKKLQEEITNLALREQQRVGQQLHDGLGQHLTGMGFVAKTLQRKLEAEQSPSAPLAAELARLTAEAQRQVRSLVRGLHPVDVDAEGLAIALLQLAESISEQCGVQCTFDSSERALITNNVTATHLLHIAKEAVNNAVKYGQGRQIAIRLDPHDDRIVLQIADKGPGFPHDLDKANGMGLRIMEHRARVIGASIEFSSVEHEGALVTCILPASSNDMGTDDEHFSNRSAR